MRQEAVFSRNDLMKLQSPFGVSCVVSTGQKVEGNKRRVRNELLGTSLVIQ